MADIFVSSENKKEEVEVKKTPLKEPKNLITEPKSEKERLQLKYHTHNPLAAYSYFPDDNKINFETKEDEEKIILFLRQHPIVNVGWIIVAILMIIAPTFLRFIPLLSFLPGNFQFIIVLTWYLVTLAFVLEKFLSWYFNIFIITSERMIDIDFSNLIYKEVSDADIDKIQDVTYKMGGVIRTIFNYGDVLVQTAAEVSVFEFDAVPNPDQVTKIIQELGMKEEEEKYGHR